MKVGRGRHVQLGQKFLVEQLLGAPVDQYVALLGASNQLLLP